MPVAHGLKKPQPLSLAVQRTPRYDVSKCSSGGKINRKQLSDLSRAAGVGETGPPSTQSSPAHVAGGAGIFQEGLEEQRAHTSSEFPGPG